MRPLAFNIELWNIRVYRKTRIDTQGRNAKVQKCSRRCRRPPRGGEGFKAETAADIPRRASSKKFVSPTHRRSEWGSTNNRRERLQTDLLYSPLSLRGRGKFETPGGIQPTTKTTLHGLSPTQCARRGVLALGRRRGPTPGLESELSLSAFLELSFGAFLWAQRGSYQSSRILAELWEIKD